MAENNIIRIIANASNKKVETINNRHIFFAFTDSLKSLYRDLKLIIDEGK